MTKPHTGELVFFWILFGVVGLLAFGIMSPYFTPIFLAGVLAILFSPLYKRIERWTKGNTSLASLLTVILVLCVILIPLFFVGIFMFQEVHSVYGTLTQGNALFTIVDNATKSLEHIIQGVVPAFKLNANVYLYIESALRWFASNLNAFFSGILTFLFYLFLVIVSMFFFYRDGKQLRAFAIKWSPLADGYDESIITKIETAVTSVVTGALTTAIVQGVLVGVGFSFFGIPNPVLWGAIATVTALIPLLGTGLITMPAGAWLLLSGNIGGGIGLIIWGLTCVGLIDNLLHPYIVNKGIDVHPLLILLSVFGGLAYFGPVGFLAGPIVLAFFFALLSIYPSIIKGQAIPDGGKPEVRT